MFRLTRRRWTLRRGWRSGWVTAGGRSTRATTSGARDASSSAAAGTPPTSRWRRRSAARSSRRWWSRPKRTQDDARCRLACGCLTASGPDRQRPPARRPSPVVAPAVLSYLHGRRPAAKAASLKAALDLGGVLYRARSASDDLHSRAIRRETRGLLRQAGHARLAAPAVVRGVTGVRHAPGRQRPRCRAPRCRHRLRGQRDRLVRDERALSPWQLEPCLEPAAPAA